jgi:hypothetical protein
MQATKSKTNKELLINKVNNLDEKMNSSIESPKKSRRNLEALSSNVTVTTKIEIFENKNNSEYVNIKKEENKENILKKPKRNLDALETSDKKDFFKKDEKDDKKLKESKESKEVPIQKNRDISGLDEEIYNLQKSVSKEQEKVTRPRRDLSKLEEDVNETKQRDRDREEKRKEKRGGDWGDEKKQDRYPKYNRQNECHDNIEEKRIENLKLNININDTELFPSLTPTPVINTPTLLRNNSKWSLKSELVSSPINLNSPYTPKGTPTPVRESFKVSKNYQKNISSEQLDSPYNNDMYVEEFYDSDGNIIEEVEIENNYSDDNYYEDDDSYDVHVRELYKQKYLLEDMIEFIEHTHDSRNKQHVEYLENLKCNYVDIDDKIQKHEYLERELETIYGPSYIKYKSLYDYATEKRLEEEENDRLKNPNNFKKFLEMLNNQKK